MLTILIAFFLIVVALQLWYSLTTAARTRAVRNEIQAAYHGFAAACLRKDLPAVMAMVTPDVQWATASGSVLNLAGVEASMRAFFETLRPGSAVVFSVRSVKRQLDGAHVGAHLTVTTAQPDPAKPGATVQQVRHSDWSDIWIKGPSGWQRRIAEESEAPAPAP